MNRRAIQLDGFTLMELVLVMLVIAIAMAMVAPSFHGFTESSRSKDAAAQIVALAHYARSQAAADGRTYRLNIAPQDGTYRLTMQQEDQFIDLGTEFGRTFKVPDGSRISLSRDDGPAQDTVDFFPNGRCEVATLHLIDPHGQETLIGAQSPTELFQVLSDPQEQRR